MKDEIKEKITILLTKSVPLSESEVSHCMVLVRKYLERLSEPQQQPYTLLKFFCDWAMHVAIDRSIPAMEMLKRLNDQLVILKDETDSNRLTNGITEVVSFLDFKQQLVDLAIELGIAPEYVTDSERWQNFITNYVEIVLHCSLELPTKVNKTVMPYYQAITANPLKPGSWVIGFAIARPNETVFAGTKVAEYAKFLSLIILLSDTTRIVVPLTAEKVLGWQIPGKNVLPQIGSTGV